MRPIFKELLSSKASANIGTVSDKASIDFHFPEKIFGGYYFLKVSIFRRGAEEI
jgi:hypothetical protein